MLFRGPRADVFTITAQAAAKPPSRAGVSYVSMRQCARAAMTAMSRACMCGIPSDSRAPAGHVELVPRSAVRN